MIDSKIFKKYIEHLNKQSSLAGLDKVVQNYLKLLDCGEFTYVYYPPDFPINQNIIHQFSSPGVYAWHRRFAEEHYEDVDTIGKKVRQSLTPIIWDLEKEIKEHSGSVKTMFSESIQFGFRKGVSIPIHSFDSSIAIFVIHFPENMNDINDQLELQMLVHQFILYYHNCIFHYFKAKEFREIIEPLTQREAECLKLMMKKYSAKQISEFLDITPRTVEFHIKNINSKLNCKNKYYSIEKARALKLFELAS